MSSRTPMDLLLAETWSRLQDRSTQLQAPSQDDLLVRVPDNLSDVEQRFLADRVKAVGPTVSLASTATSPAVLERLSHDRRKTVQVALWSNPQTSDAQRLRLLGVWRDAGTFPKALRPTELHRMLGLSPDWEGLELQTVKWVADDPKLVDSLASSLPQVVDVGVGLWLDEVAGNIRNAYPYRSSKEFAQIAKFYPVVTGETLRKMVKLAAKLAPLMGLVHPKMSPSAGVRAALWAAPTEAHRRFPYAVRPIVRTCEVLAAAGLAPKGPWHLPKRVLHALRTISDPGPGGPARDLLLAAHGDPEITISDGLLGVFLIDEFADAEALKVLLDVQSHRYGRQSVGQTVALTARYHLDPHRMALRHTHGNVMAVTLTGKTVGKPIPYGSAVVAALVALDVPFRNLNAETVAAISAHIAQVATDGMLVQMWEAAPFDRLVSRSKKIPPLRPHIAGLLASALGTSQVDWPSLSKLIGSWTSTFGDLLAMLEAFAASGSSPNSGDAHTTHVDVGATTTRPAA